MSSAPESPLSNAKVGATRLVPSADAPVPRRQAAIRPDDLVSIPADPKASQTAAVTLEALIGRTIVQTAPFGIYLVDSQFRLRTVNTKAKALFHEIDPLLGRDFGEVVRAVWHDPLASQKIERFRHTLATGEPYLAPRSSHRPPGATKSEPFDWYIQRITLPDGTYGVVCRSYELSHERFWASSEHASADASSIDSEARLQLALDASGMGTFVWHVEGDQGEPDARTLALVGLPPDATLSAAEFLSRFIHPDDRERYGAAVERAIAPDSDGVLREEVRVLHTDGAERWLAIAGQTVFAPVPPVDPSFTGRTRRAIRMSGIAADITDRKRREANMAFLADIAHDFTTLSSAADIMRLVGEKVGAYLNLSLFYLVEIDGARAQFRTHHIWQPRGLPKLVPASHLMADDRHRTSGASTFVVVRDTATDPRPEARAYAEVQVGSFISVPFMRNGAPRFLLTVCDSRPRNWREDEIGLCRGLAARLFPRLDRAHAEQALANDLRDTQLLQSLSAQLIEDQDSLYETIINAAASIMASDSVSLQVLHPERGPKGQLKLIASRGFTAEALQTWEWVSPDSATTCGFALHSGARVIVPDIEHSDFMAGTVDQAAFLRMGTHAAQSTPLMSRGGKTLGMISTHWRRKHVPSERDLRLLDILARQAADLMERTQAQELLKSNESQLQEADRRKNEFLAVLSHELRNPLAPLRMGLELIRLAGDSPQAVEGVRVMMEEQVAQMVRLIDDLLDVSRITSGKIRLQRQPTMLASLLNAAIEANRAALDAARITLNVEMPDTPVLLDADPTRLVQVLSNIIHNSVKFTEPGGRIRIAADLEQLPGSPEHGTELVLIVADSGSGISKEMLPRVFELFTQDESASHRADTGLGIGLALARQLIEMHGGTIEGHSDGPGLGSVFTIRLPVSSDMSGARSASIRPPTPRISRRVVVVDDNISAANAMKRLVTALGGECAVANDGESGIKQVRAFRPDIVFLDIAMPGIDGYETCRRLRRELGSGLLVVALTGWGQEQDKEKAAKAGFDVHLAKPPDPVTLETLLAGNSRLGSPRN